MADLETGSVLGFVDKRQGRSRSTVEPNAEIANMTSLSAMRTRLTAINGTYYTSARLNNMTMNDMVFALRDAASI